MADSHPHGGHHHGVHVVSSGLGSVFFDASDVPALPARAIVAGPFSLHDAHSGDRLEALLEQRFGTGHATLEPERHVCEAPVGAHAATADRRGGR